MQLVTTLVAFIIVIGVLIFVHEAGHFAAAKAVGIQVLRFSLGFGKPIARWRRGETEYLICWIPFGGYVKMAGVEDEGVAGELEGGGTAVPVDPARAFDRKPVWARLIVICAGVTMNAVLAFVVFSGLAATVGSPELNSTQVDSVVVDRLPEGARELAALAPGDRIVRIDHDTVRTWNDVFRAIVSGPAVQRFEIAGRAAPIVVRFERGGLPARQAVAEALIPRTAVMIRRLAPGRPAERAGIQPGDVIVRVDGGPVRSVEQFLGRIWRSPDRALRLDILRGTDTLAVTVVPDRATSTDARIPQRPPEYGFIGADVAPWEVRIQLPPGPAVAAGWHETWRTGALVLGFVKGLVLREVSMKDVGGPIFVAQASGQAARMGFDWLLRFVAFFSVNLAILNLLPIPILDGGQVVFLLAEAVRRKPLPLELRLRLTQIGFVLLVGLMILATSNDLLRLFGNVFGR